MLHVKLYDINITEHMHDVHLSDIDKRVIWLGGL